MTGAKFSWACPSLSSLRQALSKFFSHSLNLSYFWSLLNVSVCGGNTIRLWLFLNVFAGKVEQFLKSSYCKKMLASASKYCFFNLLLFAASPDTF